MFRLQKNRSALTHILRRFYLVLALSLAACGTLASPVMHEVTDAPVVVQEESLPLQPTTPPTATVLPPTNTPIPDPTATSTPEPSPTPEPTTAPLQSPIDRLVAVRNAENGALLFNTFQDAANYACSNCHLADSEKTNLGPGLLNIKDRAATRIDGQSAAEYIYQSIINSKAYTVVDFDPELMPQNWAEIYSDLEIFDIVAYLMTLEGESDLNDPDPIEAASDEAQSD